MRNTGKDPTAVPVSRNFEMGAVEWNPRVLAPLIVQRPKTTVGQESEDLKLVGRN